VTVIVERKSVMPFATLTVLACISGLVIRYNALWFLIDLSSVDNKMSAVIFLSALVLGLPTLMRILFVNVLITASTGETWRVRLVAAPSGRQIATGFQDLSARSQR